MWYRVDFTNIYSTNTFGRKFFGRMVFWSKIYSTNTTIRRPFFGRMVFWTNGFFDEKCFRRKVCSTTIFSTNNTIGRPFFGRIILLDDRFLVEWCFWSNGFLDEFLDYRFTTFYNFLRLFTNGELRRERRFGQFTTDIFTRSIYYVDETPVDQTGATSL